MADLSVMTAPRTASSAAAAASMNQTWPHMDIIVATLASVLICANFFVLLAHINKSVY